jgi:hypothetical protein
MDRWAWEQIDPWLDIRRELPIGALLCVIHGPTAGRRWESSAARKQLHHAAAEAGVRRRFAPHQLRHAHAVEMAHEGVPLVVIQRQLGHANLGSSGTICKASIAARSSAPFMDGRHRRSLPARACGCGSSQQTMGRSAHAGRPRPIPPAGELRAAWRRPRLRPASMLARYPPIARALPHPAGIALLASGAAACPPRALRGVSRCRAASPLTL